MLKYTKCNFCNRNLSYRNRIKGRAKCKYCERKYRKDLLESKKQKLIDDFLLENKEIKKITGYDDYFISKEGIVYSCNSVVGVFELKQQLSTKGYYSVYLYKDGKRKTRMVHQIVAGEFIKNNSPYIKKIINHIDGIKTNNHYTNLEWCTHKHNSKHASKIGLLSVGEDHGFSKLTNQNVKDIIDLKGKLYVREIAELYGLHPRTITCIHRGETWRHISTKYLKKRKLLLDKNKTNEDYSKLMQLVEEVKSKRVYKNKKRKKIKSIVTINYKKEKRNSRISKNELNENNN